MAVYFAVVHCLVTGGVALGQALPNLSFNLNTNGKVHITWAVPTVEAELEECGSLSGPGTWHRSPLSIITNGCNCQVLVLPNTAAGFFRLVSTNPPPIGIYLGAPMGLLQPHELGMTDVPDMHTAMLQQSNTYYLWIAGRFQNDTYEGATGLLLTTDFVNFTSGNSPGTTNVLPVLLPSCRGSTGSNCAGTNFDADYAGADLVWRASNGTDLLMLYHGETWTFGTNAPNSFTPSWAAVGLARSSDHGLSWTNREAVITSSDAIPLTNPPVSQIYGLVEPGAIVASNYIYAYFAYFGLDPVTNPPPPVIQVARSALADDAAPNSWSKYANGSFSTPGLGGQGASVVPPACGCTRTAQPWPVFSTYLNAYVLIFLANEGWFFSTSTDLVTWSSPVQFFTAPNNEFTPGLPTDENVILVTPGNPVQVIGQTGLVLYAYTPGWKSNSHELWSRPFTFWKGP